MFILHCRANILHVVVLIAIVRPPDTRYKLALSSKSTAQLISREFISIVLAAVHSTFLQRSLNSQRIGDVITIRCSAS